MNAPAANVRLTTMANSRPNVHMTTNPALRRDYFARSFSTGDLIKAADVTGAALQTWIRRGLIVGTDETGVDMPGQAGIRRAFSFGNLMEVAMGAALIKRGISPAHAFKAAAKFAHTGGGGRRPGLPYPDGSTLLCVDGDRSSVMHVPQAGTVAEMKRSLRAAEGFYILYADLVFDRVTAALGWHPEAVLEAGYAEAPQ